MPVRVTRRAGRDLEALTVCIAADNPVAAKAFLDRLLSTFEGPERNPRLGRALPDLAADLRGFVEGRYVRVLHGARHLRCLF